MFGLFKKKPAAAPANLPPPLPTTNNSRPPEQFWDEIGLSRLVPVYLQLHLAARSPEHTLTRKPDGSIDTNAVPALMLFTIPDKQRQQVMRNEFTRLMSEQLPNDNAFLGALTREEIVSRLFDIYTKITGKTDVGNICRKWCSNNKLIG